MGDMAARPASAQVNVDSGCTGHKGAGETRLHVRVEGVVQGVGFRPYAYRLATDLGLTGWVRNTSQDVQIEVEGPGNRVTEFVQRLQREVPELALIQSVEIATVPIRNSVRFEILQSLFEPGKGQMVSPDVATCRACLAEVMDATDRRHRYPFTNCTNCGPRFTIITEMPYDRPNTTMAAFTMCDACRAEYKDPRNRRFHAQPNACPVCGPWLELRDATGDPIACTDALSHTADLLVTGHIVALKGLGGFLLACDATNSAAVRRLRERKRRPSKPFAVMARDIESARLHCTLTAEEEALLSSPAAPIVLARWREESTICNQVAPGLAFLGIMLPYTPLHHVLLKDTGLPLVMTSGNLSEEPIAADNEDALRRLRNIADCFLTHNRPIHSRYDDSVTMVVDGTPHMLRRARGYAPHPVSLTFDSPPILATGPGMKNTFCLSYKRRAFVSQHLGDLDSVETLNHFEETIGLYRKLFRIEPEVIAHDLHPDYASTVYARDLATSGRRTCAVQHHHAHIAACMAENGITEPVIGVAFDGSGLGDDGHVWGGEFLVTEPGGSKRAAHLEYLPLPGGDAAVLRPYRTAISYVASLLGQEALRQSMLPQRTVTTVELDTILRQIASGLNTPMTSSMGRLFDAVAAITGVRSVVDYDGQAAVELEMAAHAADHTAFVKRYDFPIDCAGEPYLVRVAPLLDAILDDVAHNVRIASIAAGFHTAVASMVTDVCCHVSHDTGLSTVALSGGVFQNRLLLSAITHKLRATGFKVLHHTVLPTNDACVSLGQATTAAHQL